VQLVVDYRGRELTGVVRPGESWAAAARRTAAMIQGSEPVPVDLSGEVKRFVVDHDTVAGIRAATRGDLPDLVRWRQAGHVHQWWVSDGDPTAERVAEQYGPRLDGLSPTRMWIGEVNGRSVGFLQDYRISDYPEFAQLTPDPDAIGFDYAIGDPAFVGRGLGVRLLWEWMRRAHHRFPEARGFFAAPDHRNEPSLRVLEKLGFVRGTWFDEPNADGSVSTVVGCTLDVRTVLG
jgi:RimJ/RimL family protein N-acetyltransferase